MEKIRVFEAFSGIGSQKRALENIGLPHEVVAISEIDKFSVQSYEILHGKANNLGDISKVEIDDIPDHDLFTYSFPCQDISKDGQQKGFNINDNTRSSLLWECQKVIHYKKPKYLLLENVRSIVSPRHKGDFNLWLEWLESEGYTNSWKLVNAREHGIPHNRLRVFVVSILGDREYEFPKPTTSELELIDFLDTDVPESAYLSEYASKNMIAETKDYAEFEKHGDLNIIYIDGNPTILVKNGSVKGYLEATIGDGIDLQRPNSKTRRGRVGKGYIPTLQARDNIGTFDGERIRRITPRESFKLMGFTSEDYDKVSKKMSNTQMYTQLGNSIVVTVLEAIFTEMFKDYLE